MTTQLELTVNGQTFQLAVEPKTPLMYVLRNELGLVGTKYGCGLEQCGACNILVDGVAVPSCELPVEHVTGMKITTIEGLGTPENLHPLQETFMEEQAIQCGYCTAGMIVAAQGLLNRVRYPTEQDMDEALARNLCRCGTHERVKRAIKLRVARPETTPLYQTKTLPALPTENTELPYYLQKYPELDSWLRIDEAETVSVFTGKVEYGQGLKTALAQIVAEELSVSLERIVMVMGDSAVTPDDGMTVGSMSLQMTGHALRQASAEARAFLTKLALEELNAWPENVTIVDGKVVDGVSGRETTYWQLFGGQKFHHTIKGTAQPKAAEEYALLGESVKRLDLLAKVTGTHTYVQDLQLAGMVHGRVVRPPVYGATLKSVDVMAVANLPGVLNVVRDGSFLGVIAKREPQAIAAMQALAGLAEWDCPPIASDSDTLYDELTHEPDVSHFIVDGTPTGEPIPPVEPLVEAVVELEATFTKPYHMHGTIGPSAAVGLWREGQLTVWAYTQGAHMPRDNIAIVLGIPAGQVRVIHTEGSGCYGHNGADDSALDAALLAKSRPGQPVLLKWTRANEHQWEPYQPPAVIKLKAGLNAQGEVMGWQNEIYSTPHVARGRPSEDYSGLLAAWHLAEPLPKLPVAPAMWPDAGAHRNADPLYTFPNKHIVKHTKLNPGLRVSSFRGLGAFVNVFAIESFVDELAEAGGVDPVAFRLRNLADERAKAVIEAVAELSEWGSELPAGWGRGIAFAQYKNRAAYCAVVVEVEVSLDPPQIQLKRAYIAGESGQVVNPDGLSNQLEGGFIQSASMTLMEQVRYDESGVQSRDWASYPIATFGDLPRIRTVVLSRPGMPFLGSGEASIGPTPAAIANAIYDACKIRLRDIPFRPGRLSQP